MDTQELIVNRMKELRNKHGLKQSDVAEHLGVAQNSYSNYENGIREIPLKYLIHLSRFYQVNLEYLLGLTDTLDPLPPIKK